MILWDLKKKKKITEDEFTPTTFMGVLIWSVIPESIEM